MEKLSLMLFGVTIIIHFLVNSAYCSTPTLLRMTSNGPVRGIEKTSALGQKYYAFQGVPFAAPPITGTDSFTGESVDRRFKAPEPLLYNWTEPLKAYNFSKVCMQQFTPVETLAVPEDEKSEDCLYLNIYVPGSFILGSGRDTLYGPDFLLYEDNVVVTIQYRLGIFGFLNLGFFPYTGNMGLKDQQLALKWIYKNIRYFSGRNDQILLMGQSAGGACVHFQMLNKESRRYFHRAFAQSGTALVFYVQRKQNHLEQVKECSQTKNNLPKLIEYLKTTNASALAKCHELTSPVYFRSIWVPTIESESVVGAFLTKTPEEVYNSKEAPVMDTMFSLTTVETLGMDPNYYNLTDPKAIFEENWVELSLHLPCKGKKPFPNGYENEFALLKKAYFSDMNNHTAFKQENLHFMSDIVFGHSTVKSTELQVQANYNGAIMGEPKKTFLFRFDVNAALNAVAALLEMKYKGATHVDDLCYEFLCHALDKLKIYNQVLKRKDLNYDIIMRSIKMITNFARTGDPSIDAYTRLVASTPNRIFYGEVSNASKIVIRTDIKEQVHYDTWEQVPNIYNGFNCIDLN